jgi:hypothetical protein
MASMTMIILVSIGFCVIATLLLLVRRATASVDLRDMTVSRQWLTQHQSNDRV